VCGICGVFNAWNGEPASPLLLERMIGLISHRGPDENGLHIDGAVGLGATRLSIIDLGGGHQPMANEMGDIWVAFNGEIWNYQALRKDLTERGHKFRTHSDTETIVHAYEEYGIDCLVRLHGMFAIALWDAPRKRLLLARDRVGKKPLYYTHTGGSLVFASEIKSILCHPQVNREASAQAIADFLAVRYVPGPGTLFANVLKVLPGHWLLCEDGHIRHGQYWDFTFHPTQRCSREEYMKGIREHVHRAVQERMMADVPVGALLSGGVDSSIVTGVMSGMSEHAVQTFAVGFDDPSANELPYADLVSRHFGTEHHPILVRSSDLARYWPLLTWHRDDPVSEPSDLGVYLVSRLAREHVKVVLTGEGADELFAGYPKYAVDWLARYYRVLPAALRDEVILKLLGHMPFGMRKLKMAARVLSRPAPERWMDWFGVFNGQMKRELLAPAIQSSIDLDSTRFFRRWLEVNPQPDDLSSMLYLDTKVWLPDNLLMKSDKMTMAASVEARVPLLDSHLVEYAASIPSGDKVKLFQPKYLFKQAYADFLPPTILQRKKMGFNVPISAWFRGNQSRLLIQLLLSERSLSRGFLNPTYVRKLVHDHIEGKTHYGNQLFVLASLELWFRVFIDNTLLEPPDFSVDDLLAQAEQ
jgi:asparagine synthase (glutamine-hydrolysing)